MTSDHDAQTPSPRPAEPATDLELWRRAYRVCGDLLALDTAARRQHLGGLNLDAEVRTRVEDLLTAAAGDGPLDRSAEDVFAELTANPTPNTAATIGDWTLGPELGRGGMGVVFRATRTRGGFEQHAALKLTHGGRLDTAGLARFERERDMLAKLEHPNIAGLIDGGTTDDGTPFLVLQEVDGAPIDAAAVAASAPASTIVDWMLAVCGAIAHAHRNLIVHRDLKPANILVDQHGEVRVLDFGVARWLGADAESRRTTRVLTPGYGAPEQRAGGAITTATDVYGIGAVLYSLLSRQVIGDHDRSPPPPSSAAEVVLGVDRDLDNIVTMATRPEPERRYPSVEALADDLRRWSSGLPVTATPDHFGYRLGKFVRRHRGTVLAGTVAAFALVAGAGLALWQADVAHHEAERARLAATAAREQMERAEIISEFLVSTFSAADPRARDAAEVTAAEILDQASERIENALVETPEIRRQLRSVIAQVSINLGNLERAESLLADNESDLDDTALDDPASADRRLRDMRMAARVAAQTGQLDVAQQRFEAALAIAPTAGVDERVRLELAYAATLRQAGQPEAAWARLNALQERQWIDSARAENQARFHRAMALTLNQQGRFADAKLAAENALERYAKAEREMVTSDWVGNRRAERAEVQSTLANIEANLGHLDRAYALSRASLDTLRAVYGPQHPIVLVRRNDVATLLKNLGRFDESAAMLEALIGDQIEVLGDEHPYLASSYFNLAEALGRAADQATDPAALSNRALDHYRQAADRAAAAPRAFGTAAALFRGVYGHALGRSGSIHQAEIELRAGLAGFADADNNPMAPRLRVLYAAFLNDRGRHAQALELLTPAITSLAEIYGVGSRHHAVARLEVGRALFDSDPVAAREALGEAVAALRDSRFHRQYQREIEAGQRLLQELAE